MLIELKKIQDSEMTSPLYYVIVDGVVILKGVSGNYDESKDLFDMIVADPNYLTTRETVLHSVTLP